MRIERLIVLALGSSAALFLWPVWQNFWAYFSGSEAPDLGVRWEWFVPALPLAIAYRMWRTGSPRAPAWALAGILFFLAAWIDSVSSRSVLVFAGLWLDDTSPWDRILSITGIDIPRTLAFLASLGIGIKLVQALLLDRRLREHFSAEVASDLGAHSDLWRDSGSLSRSRLVATVGMALVFFVLYPFLDNAISPYVEGIDELLGMNLLPTIPWSGLVFRIWLPFFAAFGIVFWRMTERLSVGDEGIRLFLFRPRWTVWFAPWDRIRRITLMRHGGELASATVSYKTRFRFHYSFGVPFKRFLHPDGLAERLSGASVEIGAPVAALRSPRWMLIAGWLIVLAGIGLSWVERQVSQSLMERCMGDPFPEKEFSQLAGLFPLTALYLGSVFLSSVGVGMVTGYHRGRPMLLPMALWLGATRAIYDPVLHWLVYIAMYAILTARVGPVQPIPHVPFPPYWQWDLAYAFVQWAPLFALIGYLIGVPLARRRVRHGEELAPVASSVPLAPSPSGASIPKPA